MGPPRDAAAPTGGPGEPLPPVAGGTIARERHRLRRRPGCADRRTNGHLRRSQRRAAGLRLAHALAAGARRRCDRSRERHLWEHARRVHRGTRPTRRPRRAGRSGRDRALERPRRGLDARRRPALVVGRRPGRRTVLRQRRCRRGLRAPRRCREGVVARSGELDVETIEAETPLRGTVSTAGAAVASRSD